MKLFPHNKRAVESVLKIWKRRDSTCVVHPTGTGKGIIISTLINRFASGRHLLLAPGKHIFTEIGQYVVRENWVANTYASLLTADLRKIRDFQYIYLDEFHRCGADIWGRMVKKILKNNPEAKVLGTSATHIRYMDNVRNMSFELFEGSVASHISLHKAFIEGILRAPVYISAIYSIDEEYRNLTRKITRSVHEGKKLLSAQLKKSVIDWERTTGIDKILKKHIPGDRKKVIVFCRNYKELLGAEKKLTPILKEIFGKVQVQKSHTKFTEAHNREALARYREDSEVAQVMFTVDMFNEGLHGKDISVGIMLRETDSPQIFYQQMGRCFSAGQRDQPIIFDFVNNLDNVQFQMFKSEYEEELKSSGTGRVYSVNGGKTGAHSAGAMIEFIDETKGFRNLINTLARQVDNWDIFYASSKHFFEGNGHLRVPVKESELFKWLQMHKVYRRRGNLSQEKIKALDHIGMDWEIKAHVDRWSNNFDEFKRFVTEQKRMPVQKRGKAKFDREAQLALWLSWQRKLFANGKLSKDRAKWLKEVVPLRKPKSDHWRLKIDALKEYKKKTGGFKFHVKDSMYKTANTIRTSLNRGDMPKAVMAELRKMGYPLTRQTCTSDEYLKKVKKFIVDNGRMPGPGEDSYRWIRSQLSKYNRGLLKPDRVEALMESGVLKRNRRAA